MTRFLIVPGLSGSGPEHWQSRWEALDPRCVRVEQADWEAPDLTAWCTSLERAVAVQQRPVILVAHSLGCALIAHWAARYPTGKVLGALLVAPADVESEQHTPDCVRSFAPLPRRPLPFPSILVASTNDPYASLERAETFARSWGARFECVGALGHINANSRLGGWPEGRRFLRELLAGAPFALDARLAADTFRLGESELSLLLLMNERRYPWLILVPKRSGVNELFELSVVERAKLLEESCAVAQLLEREFAADKINVAALGNVVRQLHVHQVARFSGDPAWPGPVWGHSPRQAYGTDELARMRERLTRSELARHFVLDATERVEPGIS
jgi:predicted alpha/beta hydrolase family esterase/diadenosine tetraphosphate (Ap4A) HIT family hydrolase